MKYPVEITETLQRIVEVEADSRAEAEEKAEAEWNKEKYVLDSEDFVGATFHAREPEKEKIKVLMIKPNARPEISHIGTELENMQAVVGGNIQEYQPFEDEAAVVCNEEGKIYGLPLNRAIYDKDGEMIDIIAGTFFICDAPFTSETFQSLSDEQVKKYEKMFRDPERFYKIGNEIRAQKIKPSRDKER